MSHHLTGDQLDRLHEAVRTLNLETMTVLVDTLNEEDGDQALLDALLIEAMNKEGGDEGLIDHIIDAIGDVSPEHLAWCGFCAYMREMGFACDELCESALVRLNVGVEFLLADAREFTPSSVAAAEETSHAAIAPDVQESYWDAAEYMAVRRHTAQPSRPRVLSYLDASPER